MREGGEWLNGPMVKWEWGKRERRDEFTISLSYTINLEFCVLSCYTYLCVKQVLPEGG